MYLHKHPRTGVYWVRITVPPTARTAVGKRELTRTLRTKSLEEAKRLALPVVAEFLKRIDIAMGRASFWETNNLERVDREFFEWLGDGTDSNGSTVFPSRLNFEGNLTRFIKDRHPNMAEGDRDQLRRHVERVMSDMPRPLYPNAGPVRPAPTPAKRITLKGLRQAQLDHGSYSKRSVADVRKAWDYLIELNGDVQITEIGPDQIRELRDLLLKFPVVGRTPGLKLRDAAKQEWSNTVTPRTVQKIVGFIGTGFKLARSEGWCWPDRFSVPGEVRDYCMFGGWSRLGGIGAMVCGAGGLYPSAECGRRVL